MPDTPAPNPGENQDRDRAAQQSQLLAQERKATPLVKTRKR